MRLATLPGVFRPRSDSWMLADVLAEFTEPGRTVLDPFTGSGILAVMAAKHGAEATAVDVSHRAILCTRVNARLNGVRVQTLRASDLSALDGRRFDVIAANPPYLPGTLGPVTGAARAWEGGHDGRRYIDRLCAEAPARLRSAGRLLLIHSSICGEEDTLGRLERAGLRARVVARRTGPLGPILSARVERVRDSGLGRVGKTEELLIFEAVSEYRSLPPIRPDRSAAGTMGTRGTRRDASTMVGGRLGGERRWFESSRPDD